MSLMPINPRMAVTVVEILSRSTSAFSENGMLGASKEERMLTGTPEVDPGE